MGRRAHVAIPKRMASWVSQRTVTLAIAFVLFAALCILPGLYMLGVSFTREFGGFTLENYRHLLDARQRQLLLSSTLLSTGTALLATLIGAPLGLLLARADLPIKRVLRLALVIPVVVPPYILGLAWIYIGGSAGLIAEVFGRDLFSSWTYSLAGAVIVLGIGFYPLSMLATEAAARRVDAHLEEAGLLVASTPRVLWRITLPLIAPSIAAAALIIFVLALSEFGVPGLLRVRVFTTEVFTAFAAFYDFGAATSLAVPLLGIAVIAAVAARLVIGTRVLTVRRSTHTGLPLALGHGRPVAIVAVGFVLFFSVVMPVVILAREIGQVGRVTAAVSASASAIVNSLVLATIAATIIVILAAVLGYGRVRMGTQLPGFLDLIFVVVFAVPSTVVGVGLIGLWNRPGLPGELYKSMTIIVVAYLARFVPVAALILAASVRQLPISSEEAAEVAGASWLRTFTRIVLPQIRTGLVAAWIVGFIFAFGELGATVLVTPPGESTLPVRIYTMIANTPTSEVAALALMQAGVIMIPLAMFSTFYRRAA